MLCLPEERMTVHAKEWLLSDHCVFDSEEVKEKWERRLAQDQGEQIEIAV